MYVFARHFLSIGTARSRFFQENEIDTEEELRTKPVATTVKCPVEDCRNAAAAAHENRFCE